MGLTINRSNCPGCNSQGIKKVLDCKDYTVSGEVFEIWQCVDCLMRFTQHVPDQDSIGPYYQSDAYISHTDTNKGLINQLYKTARTYTLNWKMKLVKEYSSRNLTSGSLLDIGAGTGAFPDRVAKEKWLVTGLEPDEGARKICSDKYQLDLQLPSVLFELPANHFDAITMWHVLEHVHDLHGYLEQIGKLMKKDGVALIALPNYTSLDATLYKECWAAYDVPRHLYHFSPLSVKKLAQQHGMQVIATRPMWLDAFYICMLSEKYKTGSGHFATAMLNGLKSNRNASKNKEACSSLVYILKSK